MRKKFARATPARPQLQHAFGFFRWGINPLRLEGMLEEMSRQVFRRPGSLAESWRTR
jgi:hypothetical protein